MTRPLSTKSVFPKNRSLFAGQKFAFLMTNSARTGFWADAGHVVTVDKPNRSKKNRRIIGRAPGDGGRFVAFTI